MSDTGTAVARRNGVQSIGELARTAFSVEQIELIKDTVAPRDASPAEFAMFLEISARYELDPFAKEIFLAKMKGKDGQQGRCAIIVSRDGFLQIANRTNEFEGIEGDVVRENDEFTKTAGEAVPKHIVKGHVLPPIVSEDGQTTTWPEGSRGKIVGAWATVYRKGRKPTYFYAPWSEYVPNADRKKATPWGKQESAMILKCAETAALRKSFSITGVVGEEEMAHALITQESEVGMTDYGDDPVMADWLPRLFAKANEMEADKYRPAKVRMMLQGADHEQRCAVADEVWHFIRSRGGEVPEPRSQEDLEAEAQARMAEAEEEVIPADETEVIHDDDDVAEGEIPFPAPGDPDVRR
jgi:hypothetical protein